MSQVGAATNPSAPVGVLELGRRSLMFALGGLAYKGVALLTLPILARLLSPAELGLLDLAAVLASIIGLVAALGTDQGVAYLEARVDRDAGLWTSALAIVGIIAAAAIVVALAAGSAIAGWLTGDETNRHVVVAAALYGGVIALTTTALNAIRLHASPRTYALASFTIVTVEMAAALTVAWWLESPVMFMVLAWAGGALIVVVPLLARFVPSFPPPRVTTIRRLATFGAPFVPAAVAWLLGDAWIRGAIAQQLDLDALGEYGIAFRIASVVALAVTGFGVAWQPYIYRSPPDEVHARASAVLAYLVLGLGIAAVVLTSLAPEVIRVVAGEPYVGARVVVAPLSAGAVALGAFVLVGAVTAATGSTRRIAVSALGGTAIQLVSAPFLVATGGLAGAGWASLAGYVTALVLLLAGERPLLRPPAGVLALGGGTLVTIGLVTAEASADASLGPRAAIAAGAGVVFSAAALLVRRQLRRGSE